MRISVAIGVLATAAIWSAGAASAQSCPPPQGVYPSSAYSDASQVTVADGSATLKHHTLTEDFKLADVTGSPPHQDSGSWDVGFDCKIGSCVEWRVGGDEANAPDQRMLSGDYFMFPTFNDAQSFYCNYLAGRQPPVSNSSTQQSAVVSPPPPPTWSLPRPPAPHWSAPSPAVQSTPTTRCEDFTAFAVDGINTKPLVVQNRSQSSTFRVTSVVIFNCQGLDQNFYRACLNHEVQNQDSGWTLPPRTQTATNTSPLAADHDHCGRYSASHYDFVVKAEDLRSKKICTASGSADWQATNLPPEYDQSGDPIPCR